MAVLGSLGKFGDRLQLCLIAPDLTLEGEMYRWREWLELISYLHVIPMADFPSNETIADHIRLIRGQRVMLDADLARLYGTPTRRLNEQVRRNQERFPADFMFQLTAEEWQALWSQNATTSQRNRRFDNLPLAFTEHGCLMLANVLRSLTAVQVSLLIVRAFVRLRKVVAANVDLATQVDRLSVQLEKHDRKFGAQDQAILKILAEIRRLTCFPETSSRPIGFTADVLGSSGKGERKPKE